MGLVPDASESTSRFELLVQSVSDYAIYMLDLSGSVTSWNAGAQRFKGYLADEIIGKHFSTFYPAEDREAGLPARALETAEREGRFEAEGWRVRKDGTRFWANVVIDPVCDSSGSLVGFAKITRDLTERRAAEEALRRREETFRLLVQSVTDYAIYMLDLSGRVISWNAGAQRFKGYAEDEIVGQHFSCFYREEDRNSGLPATALATATREGRFEAEGWRVRKDGTRFWASVVIDPVRDGEGRLIGFAKVTRDLSERREAEIALAEAREAFFQAQKLDAIGKLTGGVAHDFNNLLAVIIGSLDLARRRLAQKLDVTPLVANALKAAERGASLTERMLAFARKQELNIEDVDLTPLVRDTVQLLDRTIGSAVAIEVRLPADLPKVRTDSKQLELALINLAVNARDAMAEGGRVTITAREISAAGRSDAAPDDYVVLAVSDEGEGMDVDVLSRAMDPFFTTKGVGKGTGLGLSMVHGFSEQSGGKLTLRSTKGKGTVAEMWLPAVRREAAKADARDVEVAAAGAETEPLVVLAVDDDALVLASTAAMLEELGHEVLQAGSGKDALAILGDRAIDLVLTDYAMPRMTGRQLAEAVRSGWPDLPILMVSGYAELPPNEIWTGARLAKPFREDQLARAIAEVTGAGPRPIPG